MLSFTLKTLILVVFIILIRGTLPRYRIDQLINQHWRMMIFWFISFLIIVLCVAYYPEFSEQVTEFAQTKPLSKADSANMMKILDSPDAWFNKKQPENPIIAEYGLTEQELKELPDKYLAAMWKDSPLSYRK